MRPPRMLRGVAALGLACVSLGLATLQLRMARREAPRRGAEPLDLLFGIRAVARFMGLSKNQARALAARGAIPAFRLDGVTCARRSSIVRRLAALERAGLSETAGES